MCVCVCVYLARKPQFDDNVCTSFKLFLIYLLFVIVAFYLRAVCVCVSDEFDFSDKWVGFLLYKYKFIMYKNHSYKHTGTRTLRDDISHTLFCAFRLEIWVCAHFPAHWYWLNDDVIVYMCFICICIVCGPIHKTHTKASEWVHFLVAPKVLIFQLCFEHVLIEWNLIRLDWIESNHFICGEIGLIYLVCSIQICSINIRTQSWLYRLFYR